MDTVLSTVPGMHCSHCEAVIEQEVSAVPGVQPVVVDLESKRVEVTGAALDDAIRDATVAFRRADAMTGCAEDTNALITRLHRVEAQVRGIECMVAEQRDRIDVLTRIAAVRTALEHVGVKLLERHVTRCIADALAARDEQAATLEIADMLDAVTRFVRAT